MNKYKVKLASLILFFTIFATGMVIGMEKELPEEKPRNIYYSDQVEGGPQRMGYSEDMPVLPPDVKKIIANKALRVILNKLQNDPTMLIKPYKELRESTGISGALEKWWHGEFEEKKPLIDTIVLLIQNGADPNTKNYEGNTTLHLFLSALYATGSKSALQEKEMFTEMSDFISKKHRELNAIEKNISPKIKFLVKKYGANINAQNNLGNTIAHDITTFIKQNATNSDLLFDDPVGRFSNSMAEWFFKGDGSLFVDSLLKMSLNFTLKNNNDETACAILLSIPEPQLERKNWANWAGEACLPKEEYYRLLKRALRY